MMFGSKTGRQRVGQLGEDAAVRFLTRSGYRVVARNYRCREGEIDIVAEDASSVIFIEVRTRSGSTFGPPEESITEAKAARMVRCAESYLLQHGLTTYAWRIDLIAIQLHSGRVERLNHYQHVLQ